MSESGVIKNVRSGLNTTPPRHLFYKELKDTITQFLSQTLTEHYGIRNWEPPNKYLLQNYYCPAAHHTMYVIHVTFPYLMDRWLEALLLCLDLLLLVFPIDTIMLSLFLKDTFEKQYQCSILLSLHSLITNNFEILTKEERVQNIWFCKFFTKEPQR